MANTIVPDNVTTKKPKYDQYGNEIPGDTENTGNAGNAGYSQIPYMQQGGDNLIPLTKEALSAGNNQVLATAQNSVVNQQNPANSPLNNMVQDKTMELMKQPTVGLDVNSYKNNQMDQYNRNQSASMEAARQKLGATSQSGELQNDFLKNALLGAQGRVDTENKIDYDLSNLQTTNAINALAAGRAGTASNNDAYTSYVNNLATVRGMAEGGENREAAETAQANSQAWQTGERISSQDYNASQANLDRILEEAIQNKDIGQQQWAINKQGELQLKMQTNDMTQEEKMRYLDDQLAGAQADKDVGRQMQILDYQGILQAQEDERNFGYETALTNLKGNIDAAIASGNNTAAAALQAAEIKYRVDRDTKDFALQAAAQELEAKGINMEVIDTQYNQILEAYGQEAADEFIARTLQTQGVDMSKYQIADKQAQAEKALLAEFDAMKTQFGQTHQEAIDSKTGELSAEGLKAFNAYYNETMYGELTDETKERQRTAGYLNESDIPNAMVGDKFKFDAPASYNGQTIPAGEYVVEQNSDTYGSKFFGTRQSTTWTYLKGADGKEYHIAKKQSGREGNIVSNLWA